MSVEPYVDPERREAEVAAFHRGAEVQREADAALVEAAGCLCRVLLAVGCFRGRLVPLEDPEPYDTEGRPKIAVHDPERCPISLAAKIRSGG